MDICLWHTFVRSCGFNHHFLELRVESGNDEGIQKQTNYVDDGEEANV